jgi:hypothetical protein
VEGVSPEGEVAVLADDLQEIWRRAVRMAPVGVILLGLRPAEEACC